MQLWNKSLCRLLGCYYYTIANISPKYRSSLKAVFKLCLVESPILIHYGHDKILETAVNDIKKLEKVGYYNCGYKLLCFHRVWYLIPVKVPFNSMELSLLFVEITLVVLQWLGLKKAVQPLDVVGSAWEQKNR